MSLSTENYSTHQACQCGYLATSEAIAIQVLTSRLQLSPESNAICPLCNIERPKPEQQLSGPQALSSSTSSANSPICFPSERLNKPKTKEDLELEEYQQILQLVFNQNKKRLQLAQQSKVDLGPSFRSQK